jgi:hypothetical protein
MIKKSKNPQKSLRRFFPVPKKSKNSTNIPNYHDVNRPAI